MPNICFYKFLAFLAKLLFSQTQPSHYLFTLSVSAVKTFVQPSTHIKQVTSLMYSVCLKIYADAFVKTFVWVTAAFLAVMVKLWSDKPVIKLKLLASLSIEILRLTGYFRVSQYWLGLL